MIKINFNIPPDFQVDQRALQRRAEQVLTDYLVDEVQFDLSIVDVAQMTTLNEQWLHHSGSTDVLSFPQGTIKENDFPLLPDQLRHLGEIVICYPVAVAAAQKRGKLVTAQLEFYLEHGLMHLLGYHHEAD